jgi:hypothetical protein
MACSRAVLACVAALLSLGQLFALGHLVLVQHTVCARHGDVHHADDAPEQSSAARSTLPGITSGDRANVDDHDHCDGWVRLDEMAPAPAALLQVTLSAQHPDAGDIVAASPTAPIALLALAPKLPPPLS